MVYLLEYDVFVIYLHYAEVIITLKTPSSAMKELETQLSRKSEFLIQGEKMTE
jgi:hypothetical protein